MAVKPARTSRSAASALPAPTPPTLTGAQLATAFDGRLEPARTSPLYHLAVFGVFCAMILLPVVYLGIIAAAGAGVAWYATHATAMFSHVRGRAVIMVGVVYVAPLIAGGLLVLFMILPLFWRSRKEDRPLWVDRREQPLLYAYVDQLCDVMHAPRPARIDVVPVANASAHIDNGLLGLLSRRLVLTIGLPLAQTLDLRQFTGVLAHELGHFTQGGSMRLGYAVHRINAWFMRLAYGRSGIDDVLDGLTNDEPHWSIALIGLLSKLVLWIARLILMALAMVSHFLSMHLSRQAEFDADRRAARIVGGECLGNALQALPFIDTANKIGLEHAQAGWKRRALPDDLIVLTDAFHRDMPAAVKDRITAAVLTADASWFDSHPPLFKRVASLKKSGLQGVLKLNAPATLLFKEFDELSKITTIRLYSTILGDSLQPEHLVPVNLAPAASQAPGSR